MNANAPHDAIDNTIDRALSALRDAKPRSGLEGRILASLESRTTEPGGLPFHKVKGWGIARGSARDNANRTTHLALWTATSAAILAVASLIILHRHTAPTEFARTPQTSSGLVSSGLAAGFSPLNTPATKSGALAPAQSQKPVILSGARRAKSKDPETARSATNPEPFSTTNLARSTNTVSSRPDLISRHPERSAPARSRRTPVFENCSDHHTTGCPIHDGDAPTVMNGVSQTPSDAQALADLHAPSHPAPPLPLTPQEKLFLHMLRYGNLTQLAELNPEVRAKQDADETTAFKAFFPDPPPLQQPNGDTE